MLTKYRKGAYFNENVPLSPVLGLSQLCEEEVFGFGGYLKRVVVTARKGLPAGG